MMLWCSCRATLLPEAGGMHAYKPKSACYIGYNRCAALNLISTP